MCSLLCYPARIHCCCCLVCLLLGWSQCGMYADPALAPVAQVLLIPIALHCALSQAMAWPATVFSHKHAALCLLVSVGGVCCDAAWWHLQDSVYDSCSTLEQFTCKLSRVAAQAQTIAHRGAFPPAISMGLLPCRGTLRFPCMACEQHVQQWVAGVACPSDYTAHLVSGC